MSARSYALVSGIVFALLAFAHAWRLYTEAVVTVSGTEVPFGPSWAGLAIAAILAICGFRLAVRN